MRDSAPALRAAAIALQATRADVLTAGEAPNPQLSWNSTAINTHDSGTSGPLWAKSVDSVIRIDQPIERGGKRSLRLQAAHAGEAAAAQDFSDSMRTTRLAVARTYYDLKYRQETEQIAAALLELQSRSLEAAHSRLHTGDIAQIDALRLEIEVARAQADLTDAQSARAQAQIELAQLLGVEPGHAPFKAVDTWPSAEERPARASASIDDRPDITAAIARKEQADATVSLARSLQTRDISIGLQFEHYPQPQSHANSVGVGFSVPLFLRHRYEGEIARAAEDRRAAEDALRTARLAAAAEIKQSEVDLTAACAKLQQFHSMVLDRAQTAADASEYAYTRGALGLTDLLDARRALQAVKLDALAAETAYAKALVAWRAAADPSYLNSTPP